MHTESRRRAATGWHPRSSRPTNAAGAWPTRLIRREPDADDTLAREKLVPTARALRRLVYQLADIGLPVDPFWRCDGGLAFDLLSSYSTGEKVTIGHAGGVITIDLVESLDDYRESLRVRLGEPYRTMLGHFRHEVGHYYQNILVENGSGADRYLDECRGLFGDERAGYSDAIARHYKFGAPDGWEETFISEYATMHPWEDFAECFAHYLHIADTIDTSREAGIVLQADRVRFSAPRDIVPLESYADAPIERLLFDWRWMSLFFNRVNTAMGKNPVYPFEIPEAGSRQARVHSPGDPRRPHARRRRADMGYADELFDLTDRVVLVTGGSRGLGREMAFAAAQCGADVVIASRKLESCEATAEEIAAATGRAALPYEVHVGRWDELDGLVDAAYERFGKVDVLINNAGMSPLYESLDSVSEKLFDAVINLNLKGPFRLSTLVGQRMVADGGGSIINVSSSGSRRPRPEQLPYSAAKAGLNALTEGLALAFGPTVRVNTLMPGPFLTDVSKAWDIPATTKGAQSFALKRLGNPAEIIGAALYLASDASSYTSGSIIRVDGGIP